ncbi:MAG TPA: ABC transporter ATP-binding protein [Acidimicrobiales bacterium]|nr:ABC transporter ATP-binding protein [Acidimicrobiales bacterium]
MTEPLEPEPIDPFVEREKTAPAADAEAVLSVRDLRVTFASDDGPVKAVSGLSFDVHENEVLGIVGESGSGKSVTNLAVLGLLPKSAQVTGEAFYRGRQLIGLPEAEMRKLRGESIAMVFQDALAALNPVYTVGNQIAEAIKTHHPERHDREIRAQTIELLDLVGIPNPKERVDEYPHQYSGGMRQRAMIAMAISNDPDVLVADEPTTALDVTIQAQVLEVLERIQARTRSAIILITHDLGVVAGLSDRVMVMYAGRAVEVGEVDQLFYDGRHPYTLGLLASLPRLDEEEQRLQLFHIEGSPPSLLRVPPGCPFHPRCRFARLPSPCSTELPLLRACGELSHTAACHFAEEMASVQPEQLRVDVSR